MTKTTKLHEILAVDRDLENAVNKIIEEGCHTFSKKTAEIFIGGQRALEMFEDDRKNEETAQFQSKDLVDTVPSKLKYIAEHIIRYYDVLAQKQYTNQKAISDVELSDGTVILEAVPSSLLLDLESRLGKLRIMYNAIPTLQGGVGWMEAQDQGKDIFKLTHEKVTNRTEKQRMHRVLVPSTKEHPAQIEQWTEDRPVGKYTEQVYCGMISPARKSELLGRIDELIRAVKRARTRANQVDATKVKIGKKIMDYINN